MRSISFSLLASSLALLCACGRSPESPQPAQRDGLKRPEFNSLAVRRNLPLYWIDDENGNGGVDEGEVANLLFYPPGPATFDAAYRELLAAKNEAQPDGADPEGRRRALVRKDLEAGRPSLVLSDLRTLGEGEKSFVRHLLAAARSIDALYALQTGASALEPQLPADPESRSLFRRNGGPKCVGPETEKLADCSAIPGAPQLVVDAYPARIDGLAQDAPGFCARLQQPGRDPRLIDPFTVVREAGGKLDAVPYTTAYAELMGSVATELDGAAAALADANEQPLVEYLRAAALAFRDNNWWPADEAWSRMGAGNSRWYLRIGPDEVYWDPCGFKAGFHLTLARINQGSLEWQARLSKVQQEMESAIAQASGPPYQARKVGFDLPDFIDIVINAGDARSPLSGTIGQSLPNFGPVAKESRGRTVAMVNLFNEPDSLETRRTAAESVLDTASLVDFADHPTPGNLTTILHEATHNLGPSQEYLVKGRSERSIFGGPLSSLMEELKAETGALFLIEPLRAKGIISDTLARQAYTNAITWALGHISQGMWTEPGHQRKTYSQLSAIQIGFLMDAGALTWDPEALAANGTDKGAFHIHADRLVAAAEEMMKLVGGIKARADKAAAEALAAKYVDTDRIPQAVIVERFARAPRASLVYSVVL
jgi:hypothetical protein